ncbi:MAG TPA: peptidoglycan bridge formation glycyltransferase FemA/FemB family protein [Candidatus Bathyarchaeia archaeon]|nr:peptidoglycan bridge formation glycyltransferase FemA/FemB family protein [Candidatus Bathyarchaeia archaeon]
MELKPVDNKNIWDRFVLSHNPNVFLQSWSWGEFYQALGEKIFRLGFFEKKRLVGVSLLIKEQAKRGTYLSCPGGPLFDWQNQNYFKEFVSYLKNLGKLEKAVFIRVRPSISDNDQNRRFFKKAGFLNAPMHMHAETTWQLDLSSPESELLAGMRKTTRHCIRKATKGKVRILFSRDIRDIKILYRFQLDTAKRHKFVPFSYEFLRKQFEVFTGDNQALLLLAEYQKKIIAVSMIIFYGDTAVYHYSGSTHGASRVPASHLIQWEAIKEAKKRGCRIYNFWGIAPNDNPRHRFAGVTTFKKGFGGQRVNWLHAQDLPLSIRYGVTYCFETLRRVFRHL